MISIFLFFPLVLCHYHYQSGHHFKQSHDDTNEDEYNILVDFGNVTGFDNIISSLGNDTKLFYLQRHGEAYHNIMPHQYPAKDWNCYWQMQNGNENYTWYDANLTTSGIDQIQQINEMWTRTSAPLPETFYVSPLTRTLQTWKLNWRGITKNNPIVKELSRETYGISTSSKRHNRTYIEDHYSVEFESGFDFDDNLWVPTLHEGKNHRQYRAKKLLDDIFNEDGTIISLVSHSGLIKSILEVVGHRKFKLSPGQMIPVVISRRDRNKKNKYDEEAQDWSGINAECWKDSVGW